MPSLIATSTQGPVTTLTLNRPDKRNALCAALLEELWAALAIAEADPSRRVLVLRGAGPVFCAGLDLAEAFDAARAHHSAENVARALSALATTRLVTIAAVHGAALAGGAGLVSACDFAIATADAKFGFPEVHRGLLPAMIMTFLRRQLRERDIRELLLLGEVFDAEKAHAIGLLNRVVLDAAALDTAVAALATSALRGAPGAIAGTKRFLADLWPTSPVADLERALQAHVSARASAEATEGIAAFFERRPPAWVPPAENLAR